MTTELNRLYYLSVPPRVIWYSGLPINYDRYDILVYHLPVDSHNPEVLYDAMLSGLPVITDRTDLTICMIAHGINGLLCNNYDEIELYLNYLMDDPMLRESIGTAARNWAYENPDMGLGDVHGYIKPS